MFLIHTQHYWACTLHNMDNNFHLRSSGWQPYLQCHYKICYMQCALQRTVRQSRASWDSNSRRQPWASLKVHTIACTVISHNFKLSNSFATWDLSCLTELSAQFVPSIEKMPLSTYLTSIHLNYFSTVRWKYKLQRYLFILCLYYMLNYMLKCLLACHISIHVLYGR
jgi:hypothetical protein